MSSIVSDPDHARYGRHLTAGEINDLIKPTNKTSSLVKDWLHQNGVDLSKIRYSPAGDWMTVDLPVETANSLLGCKYSVFENHDDATSLIRTPEWSLPRYLHDHVETIQPTNSFFHPIRKKQSQTMVKLRHNEMENVNHLSTEVAPSGTIAAACDQSMVSPACLRTLYGTVNYTTRASGRNKMAMTNYLDEVSLRSDTKAYLDRFRPEISKSLDASELLFSQISINNGTTQQTPLDPIQLASQTGMEGNLDVQTLLGIAWPTPLTIYSTGGRQPNFTADYFTPTNTNEPYLDWVNFMLALKDSELPQVVSTSYADTEQSVSKDYAIRVCNQFAALGARGVSLLFGSGDEGVGGRQCLRNDGSNRSTFIPEFPPSCPYVTVVGGTQAFSPEVAAAHDGTGYVSGGGFGEYFSRPAIRMSQLSSICLQTTTFPPASKMACSALLGAGILTSQLRVLTLESFGTVI